MERIIRSPPERTPPSTPPLRQQRDGDDDLSNFQATQPDVTPPRKAVSDGSSGADTEVAVDSDNSDELNADIRVGEHVVLDRQLRGSGLPFSQAAATAALRRTRYPPETLCPSWLYEHIMAVAYSWARNPPSHTFYDMDTKFNQHQALTVPVLVMRSPTGCDIQSLFGWQTSLRDHFQHLSAQLEHLITNPVARIGNSCICVVRVSHFNGFSLGKLLAHLIRRWGPRARAQQKADQRGVLLDNPTGVPYHRVVDYQVMVELSKVMQHAYLELDCRESIVFLNAWGGCVRRMLRQYCQFSHVYTNTLVHMLHNGFMGRIHMLSQPVLAAMQYGMDPTEDGSEQDAALWMQQPRVTQIALMVCSQAAPLLPNFMRDAPLMSAVGLTPCLGDLVASGDEDDLESFSGDDVALEWDELGTVRLSLYAQLSLPQGDEELPRVRLRNYANERPQSGRFLPLLEGLSVLRVVLLRRFPSISFAHNVASIPSNGELHLYLSMPMLLDDDPLRAAEGAEMSLLRAVLTGNFSRSMVLHHQATGDRRYIPASRLLYLLTILRELGLNSTRVVNALATGIVAQLMRHPVHSNEHDLFLSDMRHRMLHIEEAIRLGLSCVRWLRPSFPFCQLLHPALLRLEVGLTTEVRNKVGDRTFTRSGTIWDHLPGPALRYDAGQLTQDTDAQETAAAESFPMYNAYQSQRSKRATTNGGEEESSEASSAVFGQTRDVEREEDEDGVKSTREDVDSDNNDDNESPDWKLARREGSSIGLELMYITPKAVISA